jgi:hypothetical protein
MAFQFCDSFDAYDLSASMAKKWTAVSQFNWSSTVGRFGGGGAYISSSGYGAALARNINVISGATFRAAWYHQLPSTPYTAISQGYSLLQLNGNAVLTVNTSNQLVLTAYGTSTVLATSTALIADGNFHWIEASIKLNGANSVVTVYIDNILQFSGTYNMVQAATAISSFQIGNGYSFATATCIIDDVIVWDDQGTTFNSFPLGPRRIASLVPNGAGANTGFTPSSGTNWSCAAQAYAGTATLTATSTGITDTYTVTGMAYTPNAVVNAVVVNAYAGNPAGDSTKTITGKALSSGTLNSGAAHTLPLTAVTFQDCFATDSTGAAWTKSSVAAAQFGMGD